jgi:hypothetical protein
MLTALMAVVGFIFGAIVFLPVGITIGRSVGDGEDHFLPPAPRIKLEDKGRRTSSAA